MDEELDGGFRSFSYHGTISRERIARKMGAVRDRREQGLGVLPGLRGQKTPVHFLGSTLKQSMRWPATGLTNRALLEKDTILGASAP